MSEQTQPIKWKYLPRERQWRIALRLGLLFVAAALLAWRCRAGASLLEEKGIAVTQAPASVIP